VHLAGKGLSPSAYANSDRFVVHGEVASATRFMSEHDVMVVPLRSAGGIRVKIIEAMACGKAVISTATGAEGIDGEHRKHFIIANTAEEFAAAMNELAENPARVEEIGRAARELALSHFDNVSIVRRLTELYQTLR
jgi:glycosyltransferase involved in cell wall biosynthesis